MKKYSIIIICITTFLFSIQVHCKTVTQGILKVQNFVAKISEDLQDYTIQKNELLEKITSTQKKIYRLKKKHRKAMTKKDKMILKAEELRETSRLYNEYTKFYELNINKVRSILPNIAGLRKAAKKGELGLVAKQMQKPEFKKNMKSLYGNISSLCLKLDNPNLKKEVLGFLKGTEDLYIHNNNGLSAFDNVIKNIDKVELYFRSMYAKTIQKSMVLKHRKHQTELSIDLMRNLIGLEVIKDGMSNFDPEIIEIPDEEYNDYMDSVIQQGQEISKIEAFSSPEIDSELRGYLKGPGFISD